MIEFFLCAFTLYMPDMCTCELNRKLAEHITTAWVAYGECGNYDAVKSDVMRAVREADLCESTAKVPPEVIPSGTWSSDATSCIFVARDAIPSEDWGCKKNIESSIIQEYCGKLE